MIILLATLGLAALAGVLIGLARISPRSGSPGAGALWLAARSYARLVHRVHVEGRENIPSDRRPGPLILVSNHTAGIDPILLQAACRFEIRWIMAEDMRVPALEPLWWWMRIIFVDRRMRRSPGVRKAMAHLGDRGVIGVFPEAYIERPAKQVLPFMPGVGVFATRAGAKILPVIIEDTPQAEHAWGSFWRRSRTRIRFMPVMDPPEKDEDPRELAKRLREKYVEWTGWPANDRRPVFRDGKWLTPDEAEGEGGDGSG